jgi:integral membrane protein
LQKFKLNIFMENILELFKTVIGRLRIIGFLEGVSFLVLLFIAMPLKYAFDMPTMVKKVGMMHGLLFVLYVMAVVIAKVEKDWSMGKTGLALLVSFVPFGTFWADSKIFRADN